MANNLDEYLSIPDVAAVTREQVSTWRKRILLRQIEFTKCGSNVRISRNVLAEWLKERTVRTSASSRVAGTAPDGRPVPIAGDIR